MQERLIDTLVVHQVFLAVAQNHTLEVREGSLKGHVEDVHHVVIKNKKLVTLSFYY